MKVLIVSDTHGRHAGIEEAIEREYPFQKLIHLGDAEGYEEYIAELAECPIEIVAGNNDFFSNLPDEKIIFIEDFLIIAFHTIYIFLNIKPSKPTLNIRFYVTKPFFYLVPCSICRHFINII